jgi:imidazolonepropionase-like amidohydrolase
MTSLALRGGRVWDGLADRSAEMAVVIDGGHVAALDGATSAAATLDVSGCTVMPGLIEAHAHLCFDATPGWKATYDADSAGRMLLRMATNGQRMLRAGITTVRDLGAPTSLSVELREAIASGLVEGPRLLVAGAPITTTGGHCHFMGGEADGELDVRRAVREHLKAGVDWIKVMATGGNMTPRTNTLAPQYTVDELAAIVAEAHRVRRRVTAHAHGIEGIRVCVAARVDMIEHCSFSTPGGMELDPALIAEIAVAGIIVSPTVSIGFRNWPDDGRKQRRAEILQELFRANCQVIMSTDCGIPGVPHEALGGALEVITEAARLTPVQALRLATSRSASLLELHDRGTIEPGQAADLLVVEGDPTVDLTALNNVRYVFKGGALMRRTLP